MFQLFTRRNIIIGLLAVACIVSFFTFYTFKNIRRTVAQTQIVDERLNALQSIDDVIDDLQDIESGQRGFIISRDTLFLSSYHQALRKLRQDTIYLRALLGKFPGRKNQYDQVMRLVDRKTTFALRSVNLVQTGKYDSAMQVIQSGEGRALMDSIREILFRMEGADRQALLYSNEQRKSAARSSVVLLLFTTVLLVAALIWLSWRLLREERTRRENEKKIAYMAALTEQANDAIVSTDENANILSWNEGAEKLFGYKRDEVIGKFMPAVTRSGTTLEKITELSATLKQKGGFLAENIVYDKQGRAFHVLASVTQFSRAENNTPGFVIVLRDITERKKTEELLENFNKELSRQVEEKTELVKNIVERVRDGFFSLDKDWCFTYVNDAAAREMQSTASELLGVNVWDKFPDGRMTVAYEYLNKAIETQETQFLEFFYDPFQKWFMLLVYPSATGLSVLFRDISEVKRIEMELARSNERFDLISKTTNDAVWEWNLETGELWGNEMHQRLYGLASADAVPKENEWLDRLHPDDRDILVKKQNEALASDTNVFITEYRFRTEDRGYREIYDRCYIVRNGKGKAIRMLGSMMDVTERKKAEEANRMALKLLKESELIGKTGYWKWNVKTDEVSWSVGTYRIFDETEEGFTGTIDDFRRRVEPEDVPRISAMIKQAVETKEQTSYEFWIQTAAGERKYLATTADPQLDNKGDVIYLFGTTIDLTERKKAEEKIRESEARYRALVENAVEALVVLDVEKGMFVSVSESAAGLFKMSREELMKSGPVQLSPEFQPDGKSSAAAAFEKISKAIDGEKPSFEWMHRDSLGNLIQCEVRLVRLPADDKVLIRGSIIDISERKKAEAALRDSEETRRLIMNSALDAIVCINTAGQIIVWTPQAEKIFGWKEAEALGMHLTETIIPGRYREAHQRGMEKYLVTGEGPVLNNLLEISAINRAGDEFPIELSIIPVKKDGSGFICAFIRDITARKKAETGLKESEEKIRHILSSSADDFYVIDRDFRITLINATSRKNLEKLWGKKVDTGTYILDIFPADRKDFIRENYEKVFRGDRVEYEFTNEIDGRPFWRRVTYSPVRDADGAITGGFISTTDITEKKKAEEDIMKTNARFQVVSKATSDIVWDLNLADNRLWWNDNYYTNLGYTKRKVLVDLNEWFDHIHPEDLERVRSKFMEAIASDASSWRDEYRYQKADGTFLHILDRGYIMRNEQKQPYRMIGSMVDMTPVYQVQKRVLESENRLRTILDTDPECIKLLDADGTLLDINRAGLNMIEAEDHEQVLGKNLLMVVAEEQRKMTAELLKKAFAGEEGRLEFQMITLKNRKRWCEVSFVPFRNAEGEIISVLGVTRDMTERKEAESELARNEEKYRTLVEQAADAIALYDAAGRILDVNTGAVKLLGYSKKELGTMFLKDILTPEEISRNPVRYDVLQQGRSTVKWRKMRRKDGTVVETEVRSQQLPDGRFLSVIRDLTERIKAEQELQNYYKQLKELNSYLQNVREEERSNIAREIHDELGQQLTVLKMDISWLSKKLEQEPAPPKVRERLQGLIEMVDNTVRSVRRISSELRPSMLDDLGLSAAIEWHTQEFKKRSGLTIDTHIDTIDGKLPGKVAITLFRVFQESLTNVARHADASHLTISLKLKDDRLMLMVQDNGKGFLMKDIESKKTLGILGMKERIAIIQGEYDIQSVPGKGTTVTVSVPLKSH